LQIYTQVLGLKVKIAPAVREAIHGESRSRSLLRCWFPHPDGDDHSDQVGVKGELNQAGTGSRTMKAICAPAGGRATSVDVVQVRACRTRIARRKRSIRRPMESDSADHS
jgi:hypothetical protein